MQRATLHLSKPPVAPRVAEAREIVQSAVGELDQSLVPFAMRLAEARDAFINGKGGDAVTTHTPTPI
jgi:hypothetical protein